MQSADFYETDYDKFDIKKSYIGNEDWDVFYVDRVELVKLTKW